MASKNSKNSNNNNKTVWFNFSLTPELVKRVNKYILAVANKKGKIVRGIKTKIGRTALTKWLDENEKNLDVF